MACKHFFGERRCVCGWQRGFHSHLTFQGSCSSLGKDFLASHGIARRNRAVNDGYKAPCVCPSAKLIPNPELWRGEKSDVGIFLNHKVSFELWELCSQERRGEEITKGSLRRAEQ